MWSMVQAGLVDSLNPCLLTVIGAVILYLHTYQKPMRLAFRKTRLFVVVFWFSSYAVTVGTYEDVLFKPLFQISARLLFCVIGVMFVVAGLKYLSNRKHLYRTGEPLPYFQNVADEKQKVPLAVLGWFTALGAAVLAAVVSSVWPPHYYVSVIGSMLAMPGKLGEVLLSYAVYQTVFIWPLVMAVVLYQWQYRNVGMEARTIFLRPTFLSALAAAGYLGLGIAVNILFIRDLFLVVTS